MRYFNRVVYFVFILLKKLRELVERGELKHIYHPELWGSLWRGGLKRAGGTFFSRILSKSSSLLLVSPLLPTPALTSLPTIFSNLRCGPVRIHSSLNKVMGPGNSLIILKFTKKDILFLLYVISAEFYDRRNADPHITEIDLNNCLVQSLE